MKPDDSAHQAPPCASRPRLRLPLWVEWEDVLNFHAQLLAEHGGAQGIRAPGLLESGLARARQLFTYAAEADAVDLAAAYSAGIVKNHPFADGNKRAGFVAGILFLELNGFRFFATEAEATAAVLGLASGEWTQERYAAFLRANSTAGV